MSRAFILNFNAPRSFEDILYFFETSKGSNLTLLMQDFEAGETSWSVPKYAMPGDTVLFMCAKSARANLGMAASHLPAHVSQNLLKFIGEQKKEYQRYSGSLIGCGVINTKPVYDADNKWWVSDIGQLFRFAESVRIDDFRSFITISSRGSVTALTDAGAVRALMTGSGSAVFGIFRSGKNAEAAYSSLSHKWRNVFLCHSQSDSIRIQSD